MRYIEDIKEGESVISFYLCKKKDTRETRAGKKYFDLTLADKTGSCQAKVWELSNKIQSFEVGDFIKIEGIAQIFNEEIQLNITQVRKAKEGEYLPQDYVPSTDKDVKAIYASVCGFIDSMQNKHLQQLLNNIFVENIKVKDAFLSHSAGMYMHHAHMGGLCEHTLNVVQICDFLAPRYKFVNRDLLIAAALLHDIGKIFELSPFPENDYTNEGQLLGHITMGANLVMGEISKVDGFPKDLQNLLIHCLLSHHGKMEYGSPVTPRIIEAFILSRADEMDAFVRQFEEHLSKAPQNAEWVKFGKHDAKFIRKSGTST
ncbi:MAG: HD domain-containing protein [Defluviitaleaceae bacterium]|nr:HD domain-containing protein [Defluviitaleaceae bacterium]